MTPNSQIPCVSKPTTILDFAIIGGGLSGLVVAHELQKLSRWSPTWKLIEARHKLGGRLMNDERGDMIDLGGAWIWPRSQPRIKSLIKELNISTFPQPHDPSSTRIDGGAITLIDQIASKLPLHSVSLGSPVKAFTLQRSNDEETFIRIDYADNDMPPTFSRKVVLAIPPKLATNLSFTPSLSQAKQNSMAKASTWMAGVTKVSLVYQANFWGPLLGNTGLPSSMGPAFQIYDASTKDGNVSALTFFTLVKPDNKKLKEDDKYLAEEVASQLSKVLSVYGDKTMAGKAADFVRFHVKRWPNEKYISEEANPTTIRPHPSPLHPLAETEWNDRLFFAGTETDQDGPGVMEGAVNAALRVLEQIKHSNKG